MKTEKGAADVGVKLGILLLRLAVGLSLQHVASVPKCPAFRRPPAAPCACSERWRPGGARHWQPRGLKDGAGAQDSELRLKHVDVVVNTVLGSHFGW